MKATALVLLAALALWAGAAAAFEAEDAVDTETGVEVSVEADAEGEVEERPREGAKLVRPKIFGSRTQRVNIVAQGDPRAFRPAPEGIVLPPNPPSADSTSMPNGRLSRLAPFNGLRGSAPELDRGAPLAGGRPNAHSGMGTAAENADRAGKGSRPSEPSGQHVPPAKPAPKRIVRRLGADYGTNKCTQQGGQCQTTSTCGGIVTHGICPGPSFITCCTYTSTACAAVKGSCKDTSTCSGTVVRGLCPGGNNIACCTARLDTSGNLIASTNMPAQPLQGGNCLANFNGKALADRAAAFTDAYRNGGVQFDEKRPQYGAATGPGAVKLADAASFVTSVMDSLSWNCLFASNRNLPGMIPQMKVRGGFHADPRIGDLAVWNGHVGVITDACAGNTFKLSSMGEHGAADTGCVSLDRIKGWGKGDFLGFWTPF